VSRRAVGLVATDLTDIATFAGARGATVDIGLAAVLHAIAAGRRRAAAARAHAIGAVARQHASLVVRAQGATASAAIDVTLCPILDLVTTCAIDAGGALAERALAVAGQETGAHVGAFAAGPTAVDVRLGTVFNPVAAARSATYAHHARLRIAVRAVRANLTGIAPGAASAAVDIALVTVACVVFATRRGAVLLDAEQSSRAILVVGTATASLASAQKE